MIKEYVSVIKKMVDAGTKEKEKYEDILILCDEAVLLFLNERNFVGYQGTPIFRISTDERLEIAEEKLKRCNINSDFALKEIIKEKMSNIEHFVEKYRIGFVRSAELQESGYIKVEIPCLITKRGYDSNPYSADVLFKMQLDFLEENGFVLKSDKMGIYLENNEKNISNIRKLLENRKCKQIEFNLLDERIRSISFMINVLDVEKLNEDVPKFKLSKINVLNEDEIMLLQKYIKEIVFAEEFIGYSENKCDDTCCYLIESYYSQICDIFDFNGKVKKQHEDRFVKEREKNAKIRKIEEQIVSICNNTDIKEKLTQIKEKVEKLTVENLCFSVGNFCFDKYGILNMNLRYVTNPLFLMVENCMTENDVKKKYSTTIGDRENEDLYITDTYENKEKIEKELKQLIPDVIVKDFSITKRNGYYVITGLNVFVDEIINLIGGESKCGD